MPVPELDKWWLEALYVIGAGAATVALGVWAALKKMGRRNNHGAPNLSNVKAIDLERLHRQIQEEAKDARHDDIYPEINKVSIENEKDIARVMLRVDLVAENSAVEIKRVETILGEFARSIDIRLSSLQSDVAVLKDRSDRRQPR